MLLKNPDLYYWDRLKYIVTGIAPFSSNLLIAIFVDQFKITMIDVTLSATGYSRSFDSKTESKICHLNIYDNYSFARVAQLVASQLAVREMRVQTLPGAI